MIKWILLLMIAVQSCKKNHDIQIPHPYVLITSGQSNINGRAPIEDVQVSAESSQPFKGLPAEIRNHKFTRTKIWIDDNWATGKDYFTGALTTKRTLIPGYTPRTSAGWEPFDIAHNQSLQCTWWKGDDGKLVMTHGLEAWIAYKFESDPAHSLDTLYLIKWAYGGSKLAPMTDWYDWSPTSDKELYYYLVNNYLKPSLASDELKYGFYSLGFWWAQGERDGYYGSPHPDAPLDLQTAKDYGVNLKDFFAKIKAEVPQLNSFNLYLQRTLPNSWTTTSYVGPAYSEYVRDAQAKFCSDKTNNATLINVDGIDLMSQQDYFSVKDKAFIHFSTKGFEWLSSQLYPLMNSSTKIAK